MSKWDDVKKFVNDNEFFTKAQVRKNMKCGNTESSYINYMMQAGFINRIGRGKYQRVVKVPESISSSKILTIAYSPEGKNFVKKLIRKQKLENINESNLS